MDIPMILSKRYPGAEWTLDGDKYAGLRWHSEGKKPSLKYFQAEWAQVEYEAACEQVEADRKVAYRLTTDPIFFEVQRGDKTEQEWLDAVQAVKDANPYPAMVFFDANTGLGSMGAQMGTGVTALTANRFVLEGSVFDEWNTAADGSGDSYANKASYAFTAELTLFAQWVPETVEEV